MRRLPGTPGTDRSARSRRHSTVALTDPACPTGLVKSETSTDDGRRSGSQCLGWPGWPAPRPRRRSAPRHAGSCDRGGARGVGGSGLDSRVGGGGAATEDDEADEQHEGRQADGGLDRGRAALVPRRVQNLTVPSASHGQRGRLDDHGRPARDDAQAVHRTVTVDRGRGAVGRRGRARVSTSSPPASATNAAAALMPSAWPCRTRHQPRARPPAQRRSPPSGRGRTTRPASRGTSPRTGQVAGSPARSTPSRVRPLRLLDVAGLGCDIGLHRGDDDRRRWR